MNLLICLNYKMIFIYNKDKKFLIINKLKILQNNYINTGLKQYRLIINKNNRRRKNGVYKN